MKVPGERTSAKSRLTLETSPDTPVRDQGPGGSLPGPDAGHPLQGAGRYDTSIHDPEYARNDLGTRSHKRSSRSSQGTQIRKMWSTASGAVSVSAACKPICKPDAPEWDEIEETEQNARAVLVPIRRGHRIRERSSETPETYVALLITQRQRGRVISRPLATVSSGPSGCCQAGGQPTMTSGCHGRKRGSHRGTLRRYCSYSSPKRATSVGSS
jgi:hypothetical protein